MGRRKAPEIRFNTKIYKKQAIQEAIFAYSNLAKFKVKENKDYIKVKIENIDPDAKDIIVDEFANYALAIAKKCL